MVKQVLALSLLIAVATCNVIQPRDLVDEAFKQLVELQALVQGDILAAHTDLGNYGTEFGAYASNVAKQGIVSLQLESDTTSEQLQAVKDLAHAAGADVSTCTNVREDVLNRLPQRFADQISTCVGNLGSEAQRLLEDARYTVDVAFNKVRQLEWQINNCNGNLLCISPVLTEIELDKIRLPQNIKTETLAAKTLVTNLRINVDDCSTAKIAQYATEANSILADIVACVNRIIS